MVVEIQRRSRLAVASLVSVVCASCVLLWSDTGKLNPLSNNERKALCAASDSVRLSVEFVVDGVGIAAAYDSGDLDIPETVGPCREHVHTQGNLAQDQFEAVLSLAQNPHLGGVGPHQASIWRHLACRCTAEPTTGQYNQVCLVRSIQVDLRPFGAAALENHPLWITVRVPKDAAPGLYRGEITLTATAWSCAVPVELRVRGFTLPDRPSVRSSFGLPTGDIKAYHNLETREEVEKVVDLYYQDLRDHNFCRRGVSASISSPVI